MVVVGLDLAGSEARPSGLCILRDMSAKTCVLYSDEEIIESIEHSKPNIIAIDAPLCLPKGRKSLEQRSPIHLRECDRELLKRGIRFFPVTLGPMRKLTARGIRLRKILEEKGFKVIEVYPGGAQDVLGIPRKQHGLDKLRRALQKVRIKGLNERMTHDELDAVTSALVGKMFLEDRTETFGKIDGQIVMPRV